MSGGATLGGIDMRRVTATEVADARVKEIDGKLKDLGDERAELLETKSSYEAEVKAAQHARTESGKALSAQMLVADSAPERARALRARLSSEEERARTEMRRLVIEVQDVDIEIAALKRERAGLGSSATDTWTATVHLEVNKSGRVTLDLSYLVQGARWRPHYDIRGDASGSVELALTALVTQNSGEDWESVALTVSSAQPSRGTNVPRLDPFWLQRPQPVRRAPRSRAAPAPAAMGAVAMAESVPMDAPEPEPMIEMQVATAAVDVQLSATAFSVERAEDVPADGSERKVLLTTEKLDADLRHLVVPRLDTDAYLVGEVTNTASFPLLPGEAGVFLEGAYVGDFRLQNVPPGETFDVAFGADDRVAVKRRPREIDVGGTGVTGKRAKAKWIWEITLSNGHKSGIPVEVQEQVPVTSRDDVEVKRLSDPTEPESEQDEQGRISFELDLNAGEKKTFAWGYQVEYPSDISLGWME